MLSILNIAFFVLHNALIVFNLTGWIWKKTRTIHLVTMAATLFSWIVMGAFHGFGYCLCADWHFQIRRQLGIHSQESSYTEMLFNQIPGVTVSRQFADVVTVGGMLCAMIATGIVWWKDRTMRRLDEG